MCLFKKNTNNMLAENQYGTGFTPDIPKNTDYVFAGEEDFDWTKGFDIEEKIRQALGVVKFELPPNNQEKSSSCVAQAWDKYAEVKYLLEKKKNINLSPRYIYSHIHLPNGGAYIYDGGEFVRDNGIVPDKNLPSTPATEENLRDKGKLDDGVGTDLEIFKEIIRGGKIFSVWRNINTFAKAMRENDGLIFGVIGNNNSTWHSLYPKPPLEIDDAQWGHAIYAGKAKMIGGIKYIGILNSWGTNVGDRGWQWLSEDYINKEFAFTGFTWAPIIGQINRLQLYKDIEKYFTDNKITSFAKMSLMWKDIQFLFKTDLTLGHYIDYLQTKNYL